MYEYISYTMNHSTQCNKRRAFSERERAIYRKNNEEHSARERERESE